MFPSQFFSSQGAYGHPSQFGGQLQHPMQAQFVGMMAPSFSPYGISPLSRAVFQHPVFADIAIPKRDPMIERALTILTPLVGPEHAYVFGTMLHDRYRDQQGDKLISALVDSCRYYKQSEQIIRKIASGIPLDPQQVLHALLQDREKAAEVDEIIDAVIQHRRWRGIDCVASSLGALQEGIMGHGVLNSLALKEVYDAKFLDQLAAALNAFGEAEFQRMYVCSPKGQMGGYGGLTGGFTGGVCGPNAMMTGLHGSSGMMAGQFGPAGWAGAYGSGGIGGVCGPMMGPGGPCRPLGQTGAACGRIGMRGLGGLGGLCNPMAMDAWGGSSGQMGGACGPMALSGACGPIGQLGC